MRVCVVWGVRGVTVVVVWGVSGRLGEGVRRPLCFMGSAGTDWGGLEVVVGGSCVYLARLGEVLRRPWCVLRSFGPSWGGL